MYEWYNFSAPSPSFGIVTIFNSAVLIGISHYGFNLISLKASEG